MHYLVVSNYFLQIAKTSTPRHMNMVALVAFRASEPVFVRPNLDVVLLFVVDDVRPAYIEPAVA